MKIKIALLLVICSLKLPNLVAQSTSQYQSFDLMLSVMLQKSVSFISVKTLDSMLNSETNNFYLLDTREQKEYKVSHIKGSKCTGYEQFKLNHVKHIPKHACVVVYCSIGYRSEKVAEKMKKEGFENVFNLYGGIFNWVNQGMPLYSGTFLTSKIHPYSPVWGTWLSKGVQSYE